MRVNRILTNVCSDNLEVSKVFYTLLFNFKVDYDSEWFVHLVSEGRELEVRIMQSNHELVPKEFRGRPTGMYITLVVDDASAIYDKARELGCTIVKEPERTLIYTVLLLCQVRLCMCY